LAGSGFDRQRRRQLAIFRLKRGEGFEAVDSFFGLGIGPNVDVDDAFSGRQAQRQPCDAGSLVDVSHDRGGVVASQLLPRNILRWKLSADGEDAHAVLAIELGMAGEANNVDRLAVEVRAHRGSPSRNKHLTAYSIQGAAPVWRMRLSFRQSRSSLVPIGTT